ncbi:MULTISPECIES: vWA domain-containing protein [unclassified Kaistella]|uniref:vWA domain-containing protein n=1 Tax=unclassified Kaistella TaxID=2762626 RepID=UPI002734D397|nr:MULTISPECIES: vWA domain-containing protein [unclassified Kaistella]MCZ2083474.1 VWA domain-containing protein [Flavobacteriales bacterium]MDP2455070.1 VWA domain-containing protein [Kaistella sp. SH11-4b]MDP2457978.1 VWA domain-containing protein [Kaistella sp. SH40-3]MDP2460878.1 VWA domain-containing protein [Kaistella sp. SH19-2b]
MEKQIVHNLIILDESGSMESIKAQIISGFNETVQSIKGSQKKFPEQEHFISVVSFNDLDNKLLHFIDPVEKLNEIDAEKYQPNAATPLFDAIGFAVTKLHQVVKNQPNSNVLVTIMTDGEENASREYSGKQIKELIEKLKDEKWTFTYIGTDHDVDKIALNLSISNTLIFEKNESGIKDMFEKERKSRDMYYSKVRRNEDTKDNFFEE